MGTLLTLCLVASAFGVGVHAIPQIGPVTLLGAWPVFLGASGWPDIDGAFLLKLLGTIGGVLFIWNQAQQARGKDKSTRLEQPLTVEFTKQYVLQPDFKAKVAELEQHVDVKVKEMRDSNHRLGDKMQEIVNNFTKREDGLLERLDERATAAEVRERQFQESLSKLGETLDGKRSRSIAELHQQLKGAEIQVAAVKKDAETHTQQLASVDAKLTNILQRLPRHRGGDDT